jgi:hypothetical protein
VRVTLDIRPPRPADLESLLNWLASHNARQLQANPRLPLLYDSGVVYRPETGGELWSDVVATLQRGREDCDALAAWRAGELQARGWRALMPGDPGADVARALGLDVIPACVSLINGGRRRLLHAVVRYRIGQRVYEDDPSTRLGMTHSAHGPQIGARVYARWAQLGIRPRVLRRAA